MRKLSRGKSWVWVRNSSALTVLSSLLPSDFTSMAMMYWGIFSFPPLLLLGCFLQHQLYSHILGVTRP